MRTCQETGQWGPCEGEITPLYESCGNGIDENCNGEVDEDRDMDGDGFSTCDGDCCDSTSEGCGTPELVNPGAFEVSGNDVDDDCDGTTDNALNACDVGLASDSGDPLDYASAIDLCQTAVETGNLAESRWGVITADLVLADGTGTAAANSRSIRPGFGPGVMPQFGSSLAVLANGHAAAVGDINPNHAPFQVGETMGSSSPFPADWISANGGQLPNAPGCPAPNGTAANDPVMLKLRVRVPTNANSFSMWVNFFTAEYPEFVCSPFNDFFVVLLDSSFAGQPANPADKNLAIYTAADGTQYPVGVNLASGDTGLFRQCENGANGCTTSAVSGTTTSCQSLTEITGTGFDVENPPSTGGKPGKCGQNNLAGGGTGWLETSGNVVPGEIIELRIAVWDTSDSIYDTLVLIDNFQWSVNASEPGTDIVID
jgi:hypothetical protein